GPDGDGDCTESCNEAADDCTSADPNGSACNDGAACTEDDLCTAGVCSGHATSECSGTTTTTTLPDYTCGDVNDDQKITAGDALLALRAAVGTAQCVLEVCDYTGDGKITASDAQAILRRGVGQDVPPKCPGTSSAIVFGSSSTVPATSTTLDAR